MYVICVKDPSQVLGYRLYTGFIGSGVLCTKGDLTVFSFEKPGQMNILGKIFMSCEFASTELLRINELIKDKYTPPLQLSIKHLNDVKSDMDNLKICV